MTRVNIKPANRGLYSHKYDVSTIASLDLGELLPTRVIECVPTDRWENVHAEGILRLAPLVFPPYGKLFMKHAAFFVPEHQIIEFADALHENMDSFKGHAIKYPYFVAYYINFIFSTYSSWGANSHYATLVRSSATPVSNPTFDFDFIFVSGSQTADMAFNYFKLNNLGRRLYKILKSLGYDFASYAFDSSSYSYSGVVGSASNKVNALKLLAYAKVFNDYFANAQSYNYTDMTSLLHDIRNNQSHYDASNNMEFDASTGLLYQRAIIKILEFALPHEQDMYTEAWNSPNSPLGVQQTFQDVNPSGLLSPYQPVSTSTADTIGVNDKINFIRNNADANLKSLNSNGLRILEAFDRFVRRYNLSGSKVVEKIYARFGIQPDDKTSHYAHKIYESSFRIPFYPVMSNADTKNSDATYPGKSIGSYAGMGGLQNLNIDFNYNCNDYGYIVVVSWLNIIPIMLRGFDPSVLRLNAFDFWTPEYDGKALRAIPNMEISVNNNCGKESDNKADGQIFGFTNIYDDYRNMRDVVCGDFVLSLAKNFMFGRDFSVIRDSANVMHPQTDVVQYYDILASDNPDLTNPFQMSAKNGDRFYLEMDWTITAKRPILSKSESLDLGGEGDVSIPINGQMMQ